MFEEESRGISALLLDFACCFRMSIRCRVLQEDYFFGYPLFIFLCLYCTCFFLFECLW